MMLDIAEETGELSEQNILNQVDTFMFAVSCKSIKLFGYKF